MEFSIEPIEGKSLSVGEAHERITRLLTEDHVASAQLEARIMLSHITGLSRTDLLLEPDKPLSDQRIEKLQECLKRRLYGEPLAYVLGVCEFYGIEFIVDRRVLIPRPETELLVDLALKSAQSLAKAGIGHPIIADVGTGSGCIAVALALNLPGATIYGTDISAEALNAAAANCVGNGLKSRITLMEGDLCGPLPGQLNIVTANLPYVRSGEIPLLARELFWEPRLALDGGDAGLDFIARLICTVGEKLASESILLLELGMGQADQVLELVRKHFPCAIAHVHQDLAGIDRVVEVSSFRTRDA